MASNFLQKPSFVKHWDEHFHTWYYISTSLATWAGTLFCSVLAACMFTSAEDVYSPGKGFPNRDICFNCCGKSSICWEAKENSQSIPTSHKHSLRPEESIYRLVCFPQWKRLVLSWDGKMPACTDEVQVYTPRLIHTYNLYTYRTPDGEPSIIPVEVPLSPNTQLSKWRPVPSLPLLPIHL